jgi:cell division protein FtsB
MKQKENKKKQWKLRILIPIFAIIIGLYPLIYSIGVGHGRGNEECVKLERECVKLERECAKLERETNKLEAIIETIRDSIEFFKIGEVIVMESKKNDDNIANSILKKQVEVLIKQGNNLLIDYREQTNMTYKFDTWKSNVIGILNNKDKEIVKKIDNIESKYSPGDYYSQIKDIINLLNNYLN